MLLSPLSSILPLQVQDFITHLTPRFSWLVGVGASEPSMDLSFQAAPKKKRKEIHSRTSEVLNLTFRITRKFSNGPLVFVAFWLSNCHEPEWSINGQFGVTSPDVTINQLKHFTEKPRGYTLSNFGLSHTHTHTLPPPCPLCLLFILTPPPFQQWAQQPKKLPSGFQALGIFQQWGPQISHLLTPQ